jgi:hypothetical protein
MVRGYETLDELFSIGPFRVSRGRRVRDGQTVLLKVPASAPVRVSET